ncbi:hypothetical protein ACFORL_08390 [Legionella dresdenensis]|uniref:Uncharacterized protein n=1 Tax=Legionella dresdenensis TaxID=450200 RepID=A0ABV8CGG6_9GAMM
MTIKARLAKSSENQQLAIINSQFEEIYSDDKYLESKFPELLTNYANTVFILKRASSPEVEQQILNFVAPKLRNWLNPDNYEHFSQYLSERSRGKLAEIIAKSIIEQINKKPSFGAYIAPYQKWIKAGAVQRLLLDHMVDYFKKFVGQPALIPGIFAITAPSVLRAAILKFGPLIKKRALFDSCLKKLPSFDSKEFFLFIVPITLFITSLSELQEVADQFKSDRLRTLIFVRFNHQKLNCTEQEFASLTKPKFEIARFGEAAAQFNPAAVTRRLKEIHEGSSILQDFPLLTRFQSNLFFMRLLPLPEKIQLMVGSLISDMQNEELSQEDKITRLLKAKSSLGNKPPTTNSVLFITWSIINYSLRDINPVPTPEDEPVIASSGM